MKNATLKIFKNELMLRYLQEADSFRILSENQEIDIKLRRRYAERAVIYLRLAQDEHDRADSFDLAAANKGYKALSLVRDAVEKKMKMSV